MVSKEDLFKRVSSMEQCLETIRSDLFGGNLYYLNGMFRKISTQANLAATESTLLNKNLTEQAGAADAIKPRP